MAACALLHGRVLQLQLRCRIAASHRTWLAAGGWRRLRLLLTADAASSYS
jgi:hypothetical protein